jgi:predicted Zn-dependent protease
MPRRRVSLISRGVAVGAVYDSQTAFREGKTSTGHALPAPSTVGPLPANLFLKPGALSQEQMLASVDRGVWITRLHYVNPVHPLNTMVTGMTRDGTFWIERGEIQHGIKNLRFTQSILEAFRSLRSAGSETRLLPGMVGGIRAPSMLIDDFTFTGVTQF